MVDISLFSTILALVKTLLGLSDQLVAADRQQKDAMAILFEKISACLATVSSEIRIGNIPHGKCRELLTYAEDLPAKVEVAVGKPKADELGRILASAYNVEGVAMELSTIADKEPFLKELEEASGKFQALANIIRA